MRPRAESRAIRFASSPVIAAAGIGGHVRLVLHAAGVRRPQAVGPDRPHERRHRARLRRGAGAAGAVAHGVGVVGERLVEEDDAAFRVGRVSAQLVEAFDDEHVGFEAAGRRGDGSAEAQHADRVPRRIA